MDYHPDQFSAKYKDKYCLSEDLVNFQRAEIEYLLKNEIIKDLNYNEIIRTASEEIKQDLFILENKMDTEITTHLQSIDLNLKNLEHLNGEEFEKEKNVKAQNFVEAVSIRILKQIEYLTRKTSLVLEQVNDERTYTPIVNKISNLEGYNLRKHEVLNVIFKFFPVPDDTVSWDELIEFKNNENVIIARKRFLSWVTKMSHSKYLKPEIIEELDLLLLEYERTMKRYKLKYRMKTLEIILKPLDIVENILKLNWMKAFRSAVMFRSQKTNLLLGESKGPGREVAYLSYINNKFKKASNK
ncbi:MAG: hypothetical protein AAGA77_24970 [Bacteroidota bacterium]